MPVHPDVLSSLAIDYTKNMTSIRGRRVQRLLKREFSGAEHVLRARTGSGAELVLGLSPQGAAICVTDGTGPHAAVVKWRHGALAALETRFDLRKDSLPALDDRPLSFARLREQTRLQARLDGVPSPAGPWVAQALRVLA